MPPDEPPPEGDCMPPDDPPDGEGIPPDGEGIPPDGEGIPPPDGGMGMVTPPDVCTPPVVLQPLATSAATASVRSGLSSGLAMRRSSRCRMVVRLS